MKIFLVLVIVLLAFIASMLLYIYCKISDAYNLLINIADNTASTNCKCDDMQRSLHAISCNTLDSNYGVTSLTHIRHRLDRKFWCKWRVMHDVTHAKH